MNLNSSTEPKPAAPGMRFAPVITLLVAAGAILTHFTGGGHNEQRLAQLALLGLALCYLLCRPACLSWPSGITGKILLPAFFVLGTISAALAHSPPHALLEAGFLFSLLVVAFAMAREMQHDYCRKLSWVLHITAVGCALYLLKLAAGYAIALSFGAMPAQHTFFYSFSNLRFFNHAQTITLPLLILLCCLPAGRRWHKAGACLVASCWWALLFASGGRGTLLGMLTGVLVLLVLGRRAAMPFCRMLVLTAVTGFLLHIVIFTMIPNALGIQPFSDIQEHVSRTMTAPTSLRDVLWRRCLELIAAHPILGVGPMHFAHFGTDLQIASHPHNWFLQLATEWGIPAALCASLAIAAGARRIARCGPRQVGGDAVRQSTASMLILTGTAIVVDGLVSGNIVMPVSQLYLVLYIGCAAGWVASCAPAAAATPHSRPARLALAAALGAATLAVALGVSLDAHLLPGSAEHFGMLFENVRHFQPRFWLDGRF